MKLGIVGSWLRDNDLISFLLLRFQYYNTNKYDKQRD